MSLTLRTVRAPVAVPEQPVAPAVSIPPPATLTAPQEASTVKKPNTRTLKNKFINQYKKLKLPSFTQWAISRGYLKGQKLNEVAALSQKASNLRRDATIVSTLNALSAAGTASTAAAIAAGATVVGLPVAVGLLALSIGISGLMSMVSMNIEFHSNLAVIQHEVDRFQKIAKVMELIAAENKFQLNSGGVHTFITKLNNYITYYATPDVVEVINQYRQEDPVLMNEAIQKSSFWDKIAAKRDRMMAPGECLRQLVRDITILTVFMSIMIGEFIIFYEYQANKRGKTFEWTKKPEFKEMLMDTLRLTGVAIPTVEETPEQYRKRQLATILTRTEMKNGKEVIVQGKGEKFPEFYEPLLTNIESPSKKNIQEGIKTYYNRVLKQMQATPEEIAAAKEQLRKSVDAVKAIQESKRLENEELARAVEAARIEQIKSLSKDVALEVVAEKLKQGKTQEAGEILANSGEEKPETPDPANMGPATPGGGGRRRRDKTRRRRRYR